MPPRMPKPPQQGQNQGGLNYKLPPRPSSRQQSGSTKNQSYDYNRGSSSR